MSHTYFTVTLMYSSYRRKHISLFYYRGSQLFWCGDPQQRNWLDYLSLSQLLCLYYTFHNRKFIFKENMRHVVMLLTYLFYNIIWVSKHYNSFSVVVVIAKFKMATTIMFPVLLTSKKNLTESERSSLSYTNVNYICTMYNIE